MAFEVIFTTGLDGLPSGEGVAPSTAYDNTAVGTLYMFADFQLDVELVGAPTNQNEPVRLYILPALDGTNYVDGDGSPGSLVLPPTCHNGSFPLFQHANPQVLLLPRVILPAAPFKTFVFNASTQDFEATGNVLSMRPYGQALT